MKLNHVCATLAVLMVALWLSTCAWAARQEKILHAFLGDRANIPLAPLVADAAGNFYGTTSRNVGVVYEMSPRSGGRWTYSLLHAFNGTDGYDPSEGRLLLDSAGNLYGTTAFGGANDCGTVFELSPGSGGQWKFKLLHDFKGRDGCNSFTSLAMDAQGNLYGATARGGANGFGVVFQLTPGVGGHWTETVLHAFDVTDGQGVLAGLLFDAGGNNLYGATQYRVFVLSRKSGGGWKERTAYRFQSKDGNSPTGELVFDSAGNLYGADQTGGRNSYGTVFRLTPRSGGGWTSTVLHRFPTNGLDGAYPNGSLALDAAGNVYGTAAKGGSTYDEGVVFKITQTRKESVLYTFTTLPGGILPWAGVILDKFGNLYGTTSAGGGGSNGGGVVFEITH